MWEGAGGGRENSRQKEQPVQRPKGGHLPGSRKCKGLMWIRGVRMEWRGLSSKTQWDTSSQARTFLREGDDVSQHMLAG